MGSPAAPVPVAPPVAAPVVARAPRTMPQGAGVAPPPPVPPVAPAPMAPRAARVLGTVQTIVSLQPNELQQRFPLMTPEDAQVTAALVRGVSVVNLRWSAAQNLAVAEQTSFGELVDRLVALTTQSTFSLASQHLTRLLHLLELCASDYAPPSGGVLGLIKKVQGKALETHRSEIDHLRSLLRDHARHLQTTLMETEALRVEFKDLATLLVRWSWALEWLSEAAGLEDNVAQALTQRAAAVLNTAGTTREKDLKTMDLARDVDTLRDRIQDTVLTTLPSFLAAASLARDPNETQRMGLRNDLNIIIQKLKH